ncbi:MAG TPA: hypothetical protein VND68_06545 [Chloroflexia bacterium]|nr:hypothetical protein [Chloroflexia bacterium]
MNGDLSQLVTLAAYGNAFLAREGADPPELVGHNPMFNFTSLKFVRDPRPHGDGMRGTLVAESTAGWYAGLRELGARSIWLVRRGDSTTEDMPRHALVAFAGGGDWHLQVDYRDKSEVWSANWHFTGKPGAGHWYVTYAAVPLDEVPQAEKHDLAEVGARLRQALVEIEQLARANAEEAWADIFKAARDELDSHGEGRLPDMMPGEGYSHAARRLLSAASRAWVFGGMGSWNDVYFPGEEARTDYSRLTAQLYDAVVTAAVAATNSFERPLWS